MWLTQADVDKILNSIGCSHMIIGHNAHLPGITKLYDDKVIVCDPGISFATNNTSAQVLDIKKTNIVGNTDFSFRWLR